MYNLLSMGASDVIRQTIRENYPAVTRITELQDIDDGVENNEVIERDSYFVLANRQEHKNYKKNVHALKDEIYDKIDEKLDVINDHITTLENDVNSRFTTMDNRVSIIETNIRNINTQNQELADIVNRNLQDMNSRINGLRNDITTNTNNINTINDNINTINDKISTLESKVEDIINNGGGEGGQDNPPKPPEPVHETHYYFWLIDETHLQSYISNTYFTSDFVNYNVNHTINECPFLVDESYNVYNIITNKFGEINVNQNIYIILPKKYLKYSETVDALLKINNKVLTSNGFQYNVDISETEYKLPADVDEDNISYLIITLTDELSTGLSLNI